jgi:predicted transposase YdaD
MLRRDLFEMVETICIYKFPQLTRKEVETMFNLIEIQDTKVYQEAFEEGKLEGIEMVLDSKFGVEGLRLIPEIRKVKDMDVLETIRVALRSAKTIEELRSIYQQ